MLNTFTMELYECEHSGDEEDYVGRLDDHPSIKFVEVVERPYQRSYGEECVVVRVGVTDTSMNETDVEAIAWGVRSNNVLDNE